MHELPKPIIVTSDYVLKEIFLDRVTVKGFLESLLVGENKLFPIGTKIEKIEFDRNDAWRIAVRKKSWSANPKDVHRHQNWIED